MTLNVNLACSYIKQHVGVVYIAGNTSRILVATAKFKRPINDVDKMNDDCSCEILNRTLKKVLLLLLLIVVVVVS